MKIKTYTASNLTEAIHKIKKDLGPQAVILSTKKASSTKWWNLNSTDIEVTAAIDMKAGATYPKKSANSVKQTFNVVNEMTKKQLDPVLREIQELKDSLTQLVSRSEGQLTKEIEKEIADSFLNKELPLDDARQEEPSHADELTADDQQKMTEDLIVDVSRKLLKHRVDSEAVGELADYLSQEIAPLTREEAQDGAIEWLLDRLPKVSPFHLDETQSHIITVMGPQKSGKTLSLVKLASHFILDQQKKCAFISLDYHSTTGLNQLQKYAHSLKVPCELASNIIEFDQALKRLSQFDVILVDTTSVASNSSDVLHRLQKTLKGHSNIQKALVLPASLTGESLNQMLRQFSSTDYDNLMLTHLDEVSHFGSLFNASYLTGKPLSYLTMGSQVPEDIEHATHERVIDCLFNLSGHFNDIDEDIISEQNDSDLKPHERSRYE